MTCSPSIIEALTLIGAPLILSGQAGLGIIEPTCGQQLNSGTGVAEWTVSPTHWRKTMENGSRLRKRLSARAALLIIGSVILGPTVGPSTSSGDDQMVNIRADTDCGTTDAMAVSVTLPAGSYTIVPIGPGDGGAYTALNAWSGQVRGCGADGADCERGWSWNLAYTLGDGAVRAFDVHRGFETAEMALEAARPLTIELQGPTEVMFWNNDVVCEDNVGGLSFMIREGLSVPTTVSSWSRLKALFQ